MLKIKPIVLAVLGIMGTQAYAATDANQQLQQQINQIIAQQQQLQTQVASLKQQLKTEEKASAAAQQQTIAFDKTAEKTVRAYSFVRLGSYLGEQFTQDGSELVVNAPSVLAPDAMLQSRYKENLASQKAGDPTEDTPYLVLSGELEGQAGFAKPAGGHYSSDANLTDAELAMNAVMTKWVSGLFTLAYDKDSANNATDGYDRVEQSRLYVNKAFVTIGNLMYSPVYGSIGQMYLPFGRYSYTTVSSPLTEDLARVKARAVSIGYDQNQDNGFMGHAYVFQASNGTKNQESKLQNFGLDGDYHFVMSPAVNGDAGLGYIDNFADSQGMLDNGLSEADGGFRGYSWTNNYHLSKSVAGYDAHAKASYNQFAVLAEYVTAATDFNAADLSYSSGGAPLTGAKPSAFDAQGIYSFMAGRVPSSFVLDYGFTRQALALALPKTRYGSTVNFNVWTDTVLSLEYRHDIYYPTSDQAQGELENATGVTQGQSDNVVTAQLDMYF